MTGDDNDESLMRQVQRGNREIAARLVRRYAAALLTFVGNMTGNHHTSEEIVQDVFLSVWSNRRQYRYPKSFRAWLYTIAHNRCRLHFRRRPPTPSCEESCDAIVGHDGLPNERAADAEVARVVREAVGRLPPQQRVVVMLRVWNGLSYAEIGDITNCREATARSHMHHALAAMRPWMEPVMRSGQEK